MKVFEPNDPMELVGMEVPLQDTDYMAECIVEEYMLLGWSDKQLMSMFKKPFFHVTHGFFNDNGEEHVRSLIQSVRDKWVQGSVRGGESLA
jgi:hypothetical protein